MKTKKYVYVVTIEWANDGVSSSTEQRVFSSEKKARNYMNTEYQKDSENYNKRFYEGVETKTTKNTISLCEYGNYNENHIEYSLVKAEVE